MQQKIFSHQYENGLVLLAERMPALESAAFTYQLPAGCSYEPADRLGLAGFTCDMALRGAGDRDSRQFMADVEGLGVERFESVRGAHMVFGGATVSENLLPALNLYTDLVRRPQLLEEQLEMARQVVLLELAGIEDEPSQKLLIELRRHHFPDPYGRSDHGVLEHLQLVSIDDVRRFFTRHSRPNGTILAVAGKFDWDALRDKVGELTGDWKSQPEPERPAGAQPQRVAHLAFDSSQTQIGIAFPAVPYADSNYYQAHGAIGVLGGGSSSRLFSEVREKRGLCYSVFAHLISLRDRAAVICYAGTSAERAQETLDVMLEEIQKLPGSVRQDELDRLQARIKSGLIMQQESSHARSSMIARDWYHLGRVRTMEEVGAAVDALTCDSINQFLTANRPGDFTIVTLGPQPLEVPVAIF